MPYISKGARRFISDGGAPATPGELNFQLTELVQDYLANRPGGYTAYNDVLGVLTAMQHEIYRRLVVPFEIEKCNENGEVFLQKEVEHV